MGLYIISYASCTTTLVYEFSLHLFIHCFFYIVSLSGPFKLLLYSFICSVDYSFSYTRSITWFIRWNIYSAWKFCLLTFSKKRINMWHQLYSFKRNMVHFVFILTRNYLHFERIRLETGKCRNVEDLSDMKLDGFSFLKILLAFCWQQFSSFLC